MLQKIKNSFSARLNFYLLLFLVLLFMTTFAIFYHYARFYIEQEAFDKVNNMAERTNLRVTKLLNTIEKIPENMSWMVTDYVSNPDSVLSITQKVVTNNSEIFGCVIAFEPSYFPSKRDGFAPYSYLKNDTVFTMLLDIHENYKQEEWYIIPQKTNSPYWSKPYREYGNKKNITSTYSVPMENDEGEFIGVFSVDLSADWLHTLINSYTPFLNNDIIIISNNGEYIIAQKEIQSFHNFGNIFETVEELNDTSLIRTAYQIVNSQHPGKSIINNRGVKSYAFYAPISGTEWHMAVVCPYNEIFSNLNRFNYIIFAAFILILLSISLIISLTIRKITRPLKSIAHSARDIAEGNFNVTLPEIKGGDEVKELCNSFHYMQEKLSEYIDNLHRTQSDKEKIESELRVAHDIQMGLLPKVFSFHPYVDKMDLYAVLQPARQVGGDFYDFFLIGRNFYFAVGDVSGKGVPASLLMAVTVSLIRSLSSKKVSPSYITDFLNHSIVECSDDEMFVTFFIGMLNLETGVLRYCNAGQPYPIITLAEDKTCFFDCKSDLPLGILKDYYYVEHSTVLKPNTRIFLYTDGVTDAENDKGEFFTSEKLLSIVRDHSHTSSKELIENILDQIREYSKDCEQTDDFSLLTLTYKGKTKNR